MNLGILGRHISWSEHGLGTTLRAARELYKCGCVQISCERFVSDGELAESRDILKIFVHGSVEWNFCRGYARQYMQAIEQSRWSAKLDAPMVIHQGKTVDIDPVIALRTYIETVVKLQSESATMLLLENASGQGSEMGFSFDPIRVDSFPNVFKAVNVIVEGHGVGVCIDTCHLFAAGEFDISQAVEVERFFETFDQLVGLEHLKLVHLNDSVKGFGSKVDRHANIGSGKIGIIGLTAFAQMCYAFGIPVVLETPIGRDVGIVDEMDKVRM